MIFLAIGTTGINEERIGFNCGNTGNERDNIVRAGHIADYLRATMRGLIVRGPEMDNGDLIVTVLCDPDLVEATTRLVAFAVGGMERRKMLSLDD